MLSRIALVVAGLTTLAAAAHADIVRVTITGNVEQNRFVSGALMGVPAGAPVTVVLDLDSTNYISSVALPTRVRAYPIVGNSLVFTAGSVSVTRNLTYAANFCVRNDDPRADGFFLSQGTDLPTEIPLSLGLTTPFGVQFSRTFSIDTPFPTPDNSLTSLDILGALGSWGYEDISSFNFLVAQGENNVPMVLGYERITIAALPCVGGLCPADFDCSGGVGVPDIFAFLSAWFSNQPAANFDGVAGIGVPDIFAFLSAWFDGCGS